MSHPWLKNSFEPVGGGGRARVDQFGRTIPPPHSRSRSRSRSGSRGRNRERHYRNDRNRRSSSSSSDSSTASVQSRVVASNRPKYLNARLFVANIVSKEVTKDDLIKHFEKYGNVVDVLIHRNNYAFVQYLKEDHARLAVEGEDGGTINGWKIDVKMANENRGLKGPNRGGRGGGGPPPLRGGPDRYQGSPPPRGERFDDPYGPMRRYPPPGPPGPPGEFGVRGDPYLPPDPYRRGYPDPWLPPPPLDDPYRFGDPYRDPYASRAPPPPIECEVLIVSSKLRAYGEAVEMRVKNHNIITGLAVMPEGRTAPQMVEEITTRGGLFAIFINPQNEEHRSLTVNILHGAPQEHRNMPLDDAITMVGRSFQKYVDGLREKANAAAVPAGGAPPSRVFLPPSKEVAYLLNLLADNRALTVAEIDSVIGYLKERRNKLAEAEGRPLLTDGARMKSTPSPPPLTAKEKMEITQKELTDKILSIFNSAGGSIQGVPPASTAPSTSAAPPVGIQPAPPPPPPPAPPAATPASSGGGSNLINFDNPNVQAALDNLIQTSPNLLKTIGPGMTSPGNEDSNPGPSMGVPGNYGMEGYGMYGPPQGRGGPPMY